MAISRSQLALIVAEFHRVAATWCRLRFVDVVERNRDHLGEHYDRLVRVASEKSRAEVRAYLRSMLRWFLLIGVDDEDTRDLLNLKIAAGEERDVAGIPEFSRSDDGENPDEDAAWLNGHAGALADLLPYARYAERAQLCRGFGLDEYFLSDDIAEDLVELAATRARAEVCDRLEHLIRPLIDDPRVDKLQRDYLRKELCSDYPLRDFATPPLE